MNDRLKKQVSKIARANRTRANIHGSAARPRLSVTISNMHISAQLINDDSASTIVSATTIGKKLPGTMSEKAVVVGEQIAKAAKEAKIKHVVLDRGSRKYHGRIKALADAARKNGLEF